jgi:hypothetical protein
MPLGTGSRKATAQEKISGYIDGVHPGLVPSSWLKTVQSVGYRRDGNRWHFVAPARMMAQNGPQERSVDFPKHAPAGRGTPVPALNLSEGNPNRTFQYKITPKGH